MDDLRMPKISVIIPIYNQENYIKPCIESIISQTLQEIEVLCIDDHSTDKSIEILKTFQSHDERIKLFTMPKNSGSGPARNLGLQKVQGDYIAFMDADDYYPSQQVLAELLKAATLHPTYPLAGGHYLEDYDDVVTPSKSATQFGTCIIDAMTYGSTRNYQRFIFKKCFLEENNITFPNYRRGQDPVFLAKVMATKPIISMVDISSYVHRRGYEKFSVNCRNVIDILSAHLDTFAVLHQAQLKKAYMREYQSFIGTQSLVVKFLRKHFFNRDIIFLLRKIYQEVDFDYLREHTINTRWKSILYFLYLFLRIPLGYLKRALGKIKSLCV